MAASSKQNICFRCWKHYGKSSLLCNILRNRVIDHHHKHMSSSKQTTSSTDYCVNLVKKSDYENYICTLLYPSAYRTSAFALRALNVELAQVQDVTSDKLRAIMRMQFWKDAINHIFQGVPPKTPVAMEVARAVEKHKLSKMWMTRILEARASQIEKDSFQSLDEVEMLSENTSASLCYLLLQCAGIQNVHADHAASHISRCLGLVTLLRATHFHASRSKVYVPIDLLLKHNVSEEEIKRGKTDQKVKDVFYDVACAAHQHLETSRKEIPQKLTQLSPRSHPRHLVGKRTAQEDTNKDITSDSQARSFKKDVPKAALPIFNNSVICDSYLKKLQLADFNVFDSSLQGRNNHLPLQLLKQKLKRTY